MIYSKKEEYKVKFYKDIKTNKSPVLEYIDKLSIKEKAKVLKYIEFLRVSRGVLDEPYSKHIRGQDSNCGQFEKPKNEMISRRGEEVVATGYADDAATMKSAIFWLPFGRAD